MRYSFYLCLNFYDFLNASNSIRILLRMYKRQILPIYESEGGVFGAYLVKFPIMKLIEQHSDQWSWSYLISLFPQLTRF